MGALVHRLSPTLRARFARAVAVVHSGVVGLACVAWASPSRAGLVAAAIFYPVVLLNWWAFGNRCVLTVLEEKLRGPAPAPLEEPLHFVQACGSRLMGRSVPRVYADVVSHGVVWGGLAAAWTRLLAA